MTYQHLDRSILNILTMVGVISGIIMFAMMFAALSYLHFWEIRSHQEKRTFQKMRSAKISRVLVENTPASNPTTPRQPKSPTHIASMTEKVQIQNLEVPQTTLGFRRSIRGDNDQVDSSAPRSEPNMYAVASSVAAFKQLLKSRTQLPSTQARFPEPMRDIALGR